MKKTATHNNELRDYLAWQKTPQALAKLEELKAHGFFPLSESFIHGDGDTLKELQKELGLTAKTKFHEHVHAFSAGTSPDTMVSLLSTLTGSILGAIIGFCKARRCRLKINSGGKKIDVTAASPKEAAELAKTAEHFFIETGSGTVPPKTRKRSRTRNRKRLKKPLS